MDEKNGITTGGNVIFLDFDGVLNSEAYARGRTGVAIDPSRMPLLKQIVDSADAKIVLSTSWREHWSPDPAKCNSTGLQIDRIFDSFGLQILDKTPQHPEGREAQIQSWLLRHPEVQNFVVLDDRLLSADYLKGHFIKTSNYFGGLDESDVQKAIEILTCKEVLP